MFFLNRLKFPPQAYKCGNFPQIVDMYNLRRRITNSFSFPLVQECRKFLVINYNSQLIKTFLLWWNMTKSFFSINIIYGSISHHHLIKVFFFFKSNINQSSAHLVDWTISKCFSYCGEINQMIFNKGKNESTLKMKVREKDYSGRG